MYGGTPCGPQLARSSSQQQAPYRTCSESEGLDRYWLYGPGNSAYASSSRDQQKAVLPPPPPPLHYCGSDGTKTASRYRQYLRPSAASWLKRRKQLRRLAQKQQKKGSRKNSAPNSRSSSCIRNGSHTENDSDSDTDITNNDSDSDSEESDGDFVGPLAAASLAGCRRHSSDSDSDLNDGGEELADADPMAEWERLDPSESEDYNCVPLEWTAEIVAGDLRKMRHDKISIRRQGNNYGESFFHIFFFINLHRIKI